MKIQEKFGKVIRELRLSKMISQEKLSLERDIDRTYIGDIENGNRNVSIGMIEKLAKYFQVPISKLFILLENYEKNE